MNSHIVRIESQSVITTEKIKGLLVHTCEPLVQTHPEVITFCAGLCMGGWLFQPLMRHLAFAGYKTRAVTFRGHKGSDDVADVGNLSIEDYAEDMATVIGHYRDERVVTAGHSMGGLVAPKVARELRNVVAHISMASAPPSGVFAGSKMLGYIPPHLQSIFGCKPVELDYPTVASLFYNRGSAVEAVDGYTRLCPESGRVIREIILMKHAMPKLDCPVLSIAGRYDVITPHQRKLSHQLGAKEDNIVVMNSDHMLPKPSTSRELGYIIGGWVANGFRAATEMRQAA